MKEYNLPKWPQMMLTGFSVTRQQAEEIIFRTDTFFEGQHGNDTEWIKTTYDKFGLNYSYDRDLDCSKNENILKKMNHIYTEYVHNSWTSTSYIGGPHGWCNPNGYIYYNTNIGKWPSIRSVKNDFEILSKEFPYLDMTATLMSGEFSENDTFPIVQFKIKNGVVEIIDPSDDIFEKEIVTIPNGGSFGERGIDDAVIDRWANSITLI